VCRSAAKAGNAAAGAKAFYDSYQAAQRECKTTIGKIAYMAGTVITGYMAGKAADWGANKLKNLASNAIPRLKTAVKEGAGKLTSWISGGIGSSGSGHMNRNRGYAINPFYKGGSGSITIDYKKIFFDKHPELEDKVVVHHSIEQQVLKRYPGLFTKEEINAYEMLREIPKEVNSDIHLSKIRIEWNNFYKKVDAGEIPLTKDSFFNKAKEIDDLFGGKFNSPK